MAEQSGSWDECLVYAAVSDVGMRRPSNQDARAIVLAAEDESWRFRGHVFMAADGMGAHAAGELTSELAVTGVPHHYQKYLDLSPPDALKKALQEANAEVHRRGQANTDFLNMGTTASVLVLLPQGALVAHIGDSRVYRLRGTALDQLTFDHSLVWEMRAAGHLSETSELFNSIPKNVITRSLGPNSTVRVDVEGPFPLEIGDTFLVCTDGLTGQVEDRELGAVLASFPREAAHVLVDLANLRGGPDNITAIVVKVVGERIVTKLAAGDPIKFDGKPVTAPVHPALWVITGVGFLAALGMLIADQAVPALLAACAGLLSLAAGVFQRLRGRPQPIPLTNGLGRAPYSHADCSSGAELVEKLGRAVAQLRDAADQEEQPLERDSLDEHCRKGAAAAQSGQKAESLQEYAAALHFAVQQLRERTRDRKDDLATGV